MKSVRCVCLATAVLFLGATTTATLAQAAPAAAVVSIPKAAREAQTVAEIGQFKTTIEQFIAAKVQDLTSTDAKTRSGARDILIQEARNGDSTIYLKTYADFLAADVTPVLTNNVSAADKLMAAIVVARIAERSGNSSLAGAARQMLKDPSEAIVLWGVKAAQPIIPVLAASPLDPNFVLIAEVATVAQKHSNPFVIDDAYQALTLTRRGSNAQAPTPQMVTAVLPHVQSLLANRLAQYGKSVPPAPGSDNRATNFYVSTEVWKGVPAAQLPMVQQMTDLTNAATNQYATGAEGRAEMLTVIKNTAKAFWVVGAYFGNDAAIQTATANIAKLTINSPPESVKQEVASLFAAVTKVPAFAQLKTGASPAATQPAAAAN